MALSKRDALETARNVLHGPRADESERLNRIANAMRPARPGGPSAIDLPQDAAASLKRLAAKAETNYMPLIVDVFSQVMKVDGYYSPTSPDYAPPWKHWQRNSMDARQTGIIRAALQYGASYGVVTNEEGGPSIRGASPRRVTALYRSPSNDRWPMLALEVDGDRVRLFDEEMVYEFGAEQAQPTTGLQPALSLYTSVGQLTYIDQNPHGFDHPPVVRFRDRMLLDGEEQLGIVEPLLQLQDRINETTFGMLVAQHFGAFKQRYVMGWVPESEAEEMKAGAGEVWYFEDDKVSVGQFDETDPKWYIESKNSAIRDLSAIGQVPAQNLGVDGISNISDATLAGLETGKDRKADEVTTSLGESFEQVLRLCAHYEGDRASAEDYGSEVRWKDSTARAFGQTVDGLGKLATMLGIPPEILWEDVPGWTQQKIDRAKQVARRLNAESLRVNLTAAADAARQDAAVADLNAARGNA